MSRLFLAATNAARNFFFFFLGVSTLEEMKKKGLGIALLVPAIRWLDWVLMGATAALVAFLKVLNVPEWGIFLILWGLNLSLSWSIVILNDWSGIDLTLMEGLRRLINSAIEKNRVGGIMLEAGILVRLIIWDGPDQFILFFRSRLNDPKHIKIVFVIVSGIQMALWTKIYSLGADSFWKALSMLF